jgi:hypothetical protein
VRKWIHREYFGSDWMCLVALLMFIAYCGAIIGCKSRHKTSTIGSENLTRVDIFGVSDHYALDADVERFGLEEVKNIMKVRCSSSIYLPQKMRA